MTALLDHAITVRDALYVGITLFIIFAALIAWLSWWSHPLTIERARLKNVQRSERAKPTENVRNPVYGLPNLIIRKAQPQESIRNPVYGTKDNSSS